MKTIRVIIVVALMGLSFGCGSKITVNHDFEPDADFARYKTYKWLEQPASTMGNVATQTQSNTMLDQRIKTAVNGQLAKKGLTLADASPDVLMAYHTGVENKVDVTDWGYTYGSYYYGYPSRDITVYQYQQGTLIVDMIDSSTKELVWRGSAQAMLLENPTPEKIQQRLNEAAAKMFQYYPPKK
jgi:Domain of unknown function (DUF4136)